MNQIIGIKFLHSTVNSDGSYFSEVKLVFLIWNSFTMLCRKLINDLIWLNRVGFEKYCWAKIVEITLIHCNSFEICMRRWLSLHNRIQHPTVSHPHHSQALIINVLVSLWTLNVRIFIFLDTKVYSLLNWKWVLMPTVCYVYVVSSLTRWSHEIDQERSKRNFPGLVRWLSG